jgi:hypothetical protein
MSITTTRVFCKLSQKRDIALKQRAEKLARLRVGQLAVGIELLVRVRHQHFGSEKNVGVGIRLRLNGPIE